MANEGKIGEIKKYRIQQLVTPGVLLTTKPADWDANTTKYFTNSACTTAVSAGTTFVANTYYSNILTLHPETDATIVKFTPQTRTPSADTLTSTEVNSAIEEVYTKALEAASSAGVTSLEGLTGAVNVEGNRNIVVSTNTASSANDLVLSGTIPNWAASTAYKVGEVVYQDSTLWRCSTAHTSGSTWATTNWTKLTTSVDDVQIKVDSATGSSIVNSHIATIPVTDSYSGTSSTIVTGKAIKAAIDTLDVSDISGFGAGKTLSALSETDGKISASFQNISITSSQVSDIQDTYSGTDGKAISGKGVKAAIDTLDGSATIASKSGDVVTLKAGVTETDGKISNSSDSDITLGTAAVKDYTTDTTLATSGETGKLPTAATVKTYVDNKISQGVEYLGTVASTTNLGSLDSAAGAGDWVRVTTDFEVTADYTGGSAEQAYVGDIIVCTEAKGSNTHAHWDVLHTAVDTDTNTHYQTVVGGASGTTYDGIIRLQSQELGSSSWTNESYVQFKGNDGISITTSTANSRFVVGHTNSVTAQTTSKLGSITYDTQGHITGFTEVTSLKNPNAVTIQGGGQDVSTYDGSAAKTFNWKASSTAGAFEITDGTTTKTVQLAGVFTDTATAVDDILDGSNSGTAITYKPYTSQQSKLSFDTSSTNPSRTDRLNLNGYLYATKLYSGGTEVLTSHAYRGISVDGTSVLGITTAGTANFKSTNVQFTVSGTDITAGLNVTAPSSGTAFLLIDNTGGLGLDTNTYITNVKSGKKSDGSTDITGTVSNNIVTLGASGVTAGTYSALQVNTQGIVVAGGNIVEVGTSVNGTPSANLAIGGIYYQLLSA